MKSVKFVKSTFTFWPNNAQVRLFLTFYLIALVCNYTVHPRCAPNVKTTCRPLTNLYVWYHNHKRTNENSTVDDSRESLVLETSVQLVPGIPNKCHFVKAFFTHNEKEMVATNGKKTF
jgi:hypothetical protein